MEGTMDSSLITQLEGSVLTLTMNRPDRLNALNRALVSELKSALAEAATSAEVKVVVIAGAGKGFSAGGDVSDMSQKADYELPYEQQVERLRDGMEISRLLREMRKPTIARVHGAVAGAGMSIALACDLRIAAKSAVFTTAFAKVALSGDFGGTYYLTQLLGPAKAKELYFLSDIVRADEALLLGLYSRVVEDVDLTEATNALATRLANGPTVALGYIKQNVNRASEGIAHTMALDLEAAAHIRCAATADHLEAAKAFVEKRPAAFVGR